jgi:hypothetical protein
VVFYDVASGRVQQAFDLSGEEPPPDFASGAASPGGDAMVFGSSHRMHLFAHSSQAGGWQAAGTKQVGRGGAAAALAATSWGCPQSGKAYEA